ncbi:PKD domain-containing protein [Algoriphagus chordae]|uniref:PKD domain-containing protein n=1 Tax=Algoriphagus chordae TaxID=237019 RepID=A0A2W7QWR7_9BACT|nr:PKD domain-containing protein [Algoriphagus chordae]PZX50530.1 PKD domain-containing protein [Algoriphagus chordae]
MKKFLLTFAIAAIVLGANTSCSDDDKDAIDCTIEAAKVDIHHQVDATDTKKVTFSVEYKGSQTVLDEISWDFGDGTPVEAFSGLTAEHTYADAGNYTVKATVVIQDGDNLCFVEPREEVTAK